MRAAVLAAVLACSGPAPTLAISPVMACDGVVEAGMAVNDMHALGLHTQQSGVVIESYATAGAQAGRPEPLPQLAGFDGARVMSCATGEFLVVSGHGSGSVGEALRSVESLTRLVETGGVVPFPEVRQAAESLYGPVLVLRETAQTCACEIYFDELRPAGQTPYEERTDVED